jgi:predicted ferric reductase
MFPKQTGKWIIALALVLVGFLYLLSKNSLAALGTNVFSSAAQIAALLGITLFSMSFVVASRTYAVEEAFGGLDRAYRFHHKIGVWSFSLLVAHAALVLVGYGLNGASLGFLLTKNIAFIAGEIGIIAMAAIVLTIIFAKIKYQAFVIIQKFFVIPYAFGFYHLAIVPSDVSRYLPLRYSIFAIASAGIIAWTYRELFYRYMGPHAAYRVKRVEDKGAGVVEIVLSPEGRGIEAGAGQFAYFSFRSGKVASEPHPFSFTSAPMSQEISFAAKALGDYTDTLRDAAPGDRVMVYGPYGKFFSKLDPQGKNIFIAGGIGVTPFLSAIRGGLAKTSQIFYTTKTESECVYANEFSVREDGSFVCHFHASDRRGYLSADIIEKRAGGLEGKTIYVCGPAPMMKMLADGFLAKGVPADKIIFESFSY